MSRFPFIGNTILVRVISALPCSRSKIILRIAIHVSDQVYSSLLIRYRARIGSRTVSRFRCIPFIHIVTYQRSTGVRHHLTECSSGRVGSHLSRGSRIIHFNRYAILAIRVFIIRHLATIIMVRIRTAPHSIDGISATVVRYVIPSRIRVCIYLVAVEIIPAGHRPIDRIFRRVATCPYRHGGKARSFSSWSRLEVIVYHIHLSTTRTAIASIATIINHAITEIHVFSLHGILPLIFIV